jgi:hypothetical protein
MVLSRSWARSGWRTRVSRLDRSALKAAILKQLPRCPGFYRDEIADRLLDRAMPTAVLPRAIEEMARAVIRHQLTDYDVLQSRHQLDRAEARDVVSAEIEDMLAEWSGK